MEKKENNAASGGERKKIGRPATGRTQKHMSFRCDLKLIPFLKSKPKWGTWLNETIKEAARREGYWTDEDEMPPDLGDDQP